MLDINVLPRRWWIPFPWRHRFAAMPMATGFRPRRRPGSCPAFVTGDSDPLAFGKVAGIENLAPAGFWLFRPTTLNP